MDWGVLAALEARWLGLYFLACAVGVVLHEIGHAVAGWVLKCNPRIVVIGVGPPILRWRFKDAWVVIRLLPLSGMVYMPPRGRDRIRASFLVTAAGPLANVVLLSAALIPIVRHGSTFDAVSDVFPWAFAQLWILLVVLWPQTYVKQGAHFATDGYKLYRYIAHRGDDEYGEMHRRALRMVVPEDEPLPPPSHWFPELVVQAVRRDRLSERWAREDAVAEVSAILARDDLPAGERAWARRLLADIETETTASVKAAQAATV